MSHADRLSPRMDADFPAYIPQTYDADGKPILSANAIREGLWFCALFYGSIASVIALGIWTARHFR
jgi:hypothetical protein